MIKPKFFTEKSIRAKRDEFNIADHGLFEKAIYAFELLGYLAESDLDFVFKGGTSLLLHIPEPQRLSIDIDILSSEQPEKLISVLETINVNSPFINFKEDKRGNRGLPARKHFKFYYNSEIFKREECVLLDVVEEPKCKLPIEEKVIQAIFFETEKDITVKIPTIEGLLGDKLTAFAPNTIGVPFFINDGEEHFMQVVKQLFDIGQLFNVADDFKTISEAYEFSFKQENGYKGEKYSKEQTLDDSANVALELCRFNVSGYKESETVKYLLNGISRLKTHLINSKFIPHLEGKVAASKAYMLSKMIKADSFTSLSKYGKYKSSQKQLDFIKNGSINPQFDKLKGINPEAYYYLALGDML